MKRTFKGWFSAAKILVILLVIPQARMPLIGSAAGRSGSVPKFSHVVLIIMENKEFEEVIGNTLMPNFNTWAKRYTLLTQYYAITHPSLPNYLALIGGDTFGIKSDCTNCSINARSLPDLLEAHGRSWKTYLEALPSAGFLGGFSGRYAKKHNPFLYFDPILKDPSRSIRSVVPLSQLEADLGKKDLPDFAFIVPDLCNSSHDCGLATTDLWLGRIVNSILQSSSFDQNGLIVLTFDEGTTNRWCCASPPGKGGGKIATVLISPLVKSGYQDSTPTSHFSLLKTIAEAWGLEQLGHASDPATNLILLPWKGF